MTDESTPTLSQVLNVLQSSEDELELFDPEVVIGNVEDKIDSIHYILEKMKATSAHLREVANPITKKAAAINASRERLREYLLFNMVSRGFSKLPGKQFKADLREGHYKVLIAAERAPSPIDAQTYQEFVRTEVSFNWDEAAIEKAFLEGRELPPGVSARNSSTQWVAFSVNVPAELEPKKKARAKK